MSISSDALVCLLFFLLQLLENVLKVIKTEGEVQQKAISEVYEKLNLLEQGMKNFFTEGTPSVDQNFGLIDIVFVSIFGAYKAQ